MSLLVLIHPRSSIFIQLTILRRREPWGFTVYDCRKDIRNILVTPQIRARFCRMEPGPGSLDKFHTHDLGHEISLFCRDVWSSRSTA